MDILSQKRLVTYRNLINNLSVVETVLQNLSPIHSQGCVWIAKSQFFAVNKELNPKKQNQPKPSQSLFHRLLACWPAWRSWVWLSCTSTIRKRKTGRRWKEENSAKEAALSQWSKCEEPLPTRLLKIEGLYLGEKKTDRNPRVNREKFRRIKIWRWGQVYGVHRKRAMV